MSVRNHVSAAGLALLSAGTPCVAAADAGPSFDCTKKLTSSVEQRVCADPKLAALDRLRGVVA